MSCKICLGNRLELTELAVVGCVGGVRLGDNRVGHHLCSQSNPEPPRT